MKYLIFICLICCGCQHSRGLFGGADFIENDFKTVTPNFHWIKPEGVKGEVKCLEITNNGLVLIDSSNTLLSYDLGEQTTKEISSGTENELIAPYGIFASDPEHFSIYDLTTDSFLPYTLKTNNWEKGNIIQLPQKLHGLPSIAPVKGGQFIATSINNIEGKLILANNSPSPSIISYIGKMEKKDAENKYITGMINRSSCTYDSWTGLVYVGGFYSDLLESYNLEGKKIFSLQGPDNFDPVYKVKKVKGGDQVFVNLPKTRNAFFSLTTDKKYLYALYSGTEFSQPVTNEDKTIYVFDKAGKPIKKIQCTSDIGLIRADENTHSLYCYQISGSNAPILVYDTKDI